MNPLETYIAANNLDPVTTMNRLDDRAIISSLAVEPADVADTDAQAAVDWLSSREK